MSSMKLDVEIFHTSVNFSLWQVKITTILIKNGVHKALDGEEKKSAGLSEGKWKR